MRIQEEVGPGESDYCDLGHSDSSSTTTGEETIIYGSIYTARNGSNEAFAHRITEQHSKIREEHVEYEYGHDFCYDAWTCWG